jgi:hypothetical protein
MPVGGSALLSYAGGKASKFDFRPAADGERFASTKHELLRDGAATDDTWMGM